MVCNKTGKTICKNVIKRYVLELMNQVISGLTLCNVIGRYGVDWELWDGQLGMVWYRLVWVGIGWHRI